jgi:hypothetical protein
LRDVAPRRVHQGISLEEFIHAYDPRTFAGLTDLVCIIETTEPPQT